LGQAAAGLHLSALSVIGPLTHFRKYVLWCKEIKQLDSTYGAADFVCVCGTVSLDYKGSALFSPIVNSVMK
jgi:hypothetical protein